MELNMEIIKEFINLEELHSSKSNPRTYLSVYQGEVEKMLKNHIKQLKELEELKKDNQHQWEERCKLAIKVGMLTEEIEKLKERQDYARLEKEQLLEDSISKDEIRKIAKECKKDEIIDTHEFFIKIMRL